LKHKLTNLIFSR